MKNKYYETGIDFGNTYDRPKSNPQFSDIQAYPDEQELDLRNIKHPRETREILIQLLGSISSKTFRSRISEQIAQLNSIIASQSKDLKGGAHK